MDSALEITENEYLIKLNRGSFNLSFIQNLLRLIEFSDPKEHQNNRKLEKEVSEDADNEESDIPDRHIAPRQNHNAEPDYYDSLDEK